MCCSVRLCCSPSLCAAFYFQDDPDNGSVKLKDTMQAMEEARTPKSIWHTEAFKLNTTSSLKLCWVAYIVFLFFFSPVLQLEKIDIFFLRHFRVPPQ